MRLTLDSRCSDSAEWPRPPDGASARYPSRAALRGDDRRVPHPEDLDAQRILSQYKRLVLLGKVKLPLAEGRRLVGPDTAFHLYFRHAGTSAPRRGRRRPAAPRE
jgi:hypothetical protein